MAFKNLCILVLWTKVASALEGLNKLVLGVDSMVDLATSIVIQPHHGRLHKDDSGAKEIKLNQ